VEDQPIVVCSRRQVGKEVTFKVDALPKQTFQGVRKDDPVLTRPKAGEVLKTLPTLED
jgi:hypothetical protein